MILFCLIFGAIIGLFLPRNAFKSRRSGSLFTARRSGRSVRYI